MTRQEFYRRMVDLAQFHYVLKQIAEGADGAQDMAERVLAGERSVRPR